MTFQLPDLFFTFLTAIIVLFGGTAAFLFGYFIPKDYTHEAVAPVEESSPSPEVETRGHSIKKERSVTAYGNISEYSWLTSVNMYRYRDMPNSLEFFCAGTILTANKMLTGDSCYKEHFTKEDLKEAVVRSSSPYFWKDGITHRIDQVYDNRKLKKPYKDIFIFEVSPSFPMETLKLKLVAAPSVARESCKDGKFVVAGWGGEQDQTEQISLSQPFVVYEWLPESIVNCKDNLCHVASPQSMYCCNEAIMTNEPIFEQGPVSGKVLVNVRSGSPQLIAVQLIHIFKGIKTTERDLTYFIDIGNPEFIEWIQSLAPEAIIRANEPINKAKTKFILYSRWQTSQYIEDMKYFDEYNPLVKYLINQ